MEAIKMLLMVTSLLFFAAILKESAALSSERQQYKAAYESALSEFEALARTRNGAVDSAFVCKIRGGSK